VPSPAVKTAEKTPAASGKRQGETVIPEVLAAERKPKKASKPQVAGGQTGSGKPPWGPDNMPPWADMSDFEDFGTQPGQIVNGKDYV
jgi:hypothetical protein